MNKETKRIEAYSISEFAEKIQEAVLEGFRLDMQSNENYPVQLGVVFVCGMVKSGEMKVTIVNNTPTTLTEGQMAELTKVFDKTSPVVVTNDFPELSVKPAAKPGRPSRK